MTLEEKIGQLFLASRPCEGAVETIEEYHPGGYLLFANAFEGETVDSVTQTIAGYQAASKIPMLIAVDEEGGTVTRVSRFTAFRDQEFPAPRSLYQSGGITKIRETEIEKCILLTSLGINLNLAPVCDITTDQDAFMYQRSLGQSPQITAEFIETVVDVQKSYGIGGALKHFPGYGNNVDTHVGIAIDKRKLTELESVDLIPFQAGIDAGAGAIMISHTVVNCLDAQLPASLSPAVYRYLRQNMHFTGVTITDDLSMDAISKEFGTKEAAILAIEAGCDLLCTKEFAIQYAGILEAVHSGRLPESTIDAAVLRILNWKHDLNML